jgi:Flp pilus assembly protein TadD
VSRAYTNLGDLDRAAVELGTAIELAQRSDDLLYIAKLVDE